MILQPSGDLSLSLEDYFFLADTLDTFIQQCSDERTIQLASAIETAFRALAYVEATKFNITPQTEEAIEQLLKEARHADKESIG